MFTWKSHTGFKFHFGQNDRYEIHTILSFISRQFTWTQIKSWLNTEVRFSIEMKSHTGLSSFRLSEHGYMRPEVNSNQFEILLQDKISLLCEVTSLSAFTWLQAEWNSIQYKFHFDQIDRSKISNSSEFSI